MKTDTIRYLFFWLISDRYPISLSDWDSTSVGVGKPTSTYRCSPSGSWLARTPDGTRRPRPLWASPCRCGRSRALYSYSWGPLRHRERERGTHNETPLQRARGRRHTKNSTHGKRSARRRQGLFSHLSRFRDVDRHRDISLCRVREKKKAKQMQKSTASKTTLPSSSRDNALNKACKLWNRMKWHSNSSSLVAAL